MNPSSRYSTLFLDIGGVILSNGWDYKLREKTANEFHIDFEEMNKRHALTFDTYEIGKITLDEYLDRIVGYESRPFSRESFKDFIFSQWYTYPEMLNWIKGIKKAHGLSIIAVSNEGRELMEERIKRFQLKEVIDFFVCSGFVGLRKPDWDMYRLALDLSQAKPQEVIYIDDRRMLYEVGCQLGLQGIQHTTFEQTRALFESILNR